MAQPRAIAYALLQLGEGALCLSLTQESGSRLQC